ncbi:hypothetical protein ACLKA7_014089 [Drosophila subpalustris]
MTTLTKQSANNHNNKQNKRVKIGATTPFQEEKKEEEELELETRIECKIWRRISSYHSDNIRMGMESKLNPCLCICGIHADVCFWPCFTRQSAQQHCEGGCNSCPKASINGLDPAAEADDEDEDEGVDVVGVVARLSEMPLGSSWSVQQAAFVIAC